MDTIILKYKKIKLFLTLDLVGGDYLFPYDFLKSQRKLYLSCFDLEVKFQSLFMKKRKAAPFQSGLFADFKRKTAFFSNNVLVLIDFFQEKVGHIVKPF